MNERLGVARRRRKSAFECVRGRCKLGFREEMFREGEQGSLEMGDEDWGKRYSRETEQGKEGGGEVEESRRSTDVPVR